jgi:hypothetical protein
MYKPNFCSECGAKLLRLRWHFWTSRRFCGNCTRRLRKARFGPALFAMLGLFGAGYVAGLVRRAVPPPLIIERRSDSPLSDTATANSHLRPATSESGTSNTTINSPAAVAEVVYLCGARTKKGTPCSRRVHGPVRCWQHKGMPAMLPQNKLRIDD